MPARALVGLTALIFAGSVRAADPPAVLRILSEQLRASAPLRDFEHIRADQANSLRGIEFAPPSIALSSLSGGPELWRAEFHPSFAAMEDAMNSLAQFTPSRQIDARAAEFLDSRRTMIAVYRDGLSLQVQQAMAALPRARYLLIRMVEVRSGRERDFSQSFRAVLAANDRAGLDQPMLAYQVFSGARPSTYLFLQPLRSLASMDSMMAEIGRTYETLGPEATSKVRSVITDTVLSDERLLFQVSPALSIPPKEFLDIDRDFWAQAPVNN